MNHLEKMQTILEEVKSINDDISKSLRSIKNNVAEIDTLVERAHRDADVARERLNRNEWLLITALSIGVGALLLFLVWWYY